MALTKKMLQAMNIEEAQIEQIFEAHGETVSGLTKTRDDLQAELKKAQEELERLRKVEKDLVKANAKIEDLQGADKKLTELQEEFDNYKSSIKTENIMRSKESAFTKLLADAGVSEKRFKSIVKVTDLKEFELDEDGGFVNSDSLLEDIKKEWADFIVEKSKQGAKVATPPKSTGGSFMTKEDIMKITDTQKRQKAWAEFLENERKK